MNKAAQKRAELNRASQKQGDRDHPIIARLGVPHGGQGGAFLRRAGPLRAVIRRVNPGHVVFRRGRHELGVRADTIVFRQRP